MFRDSRVADRDLTGTSFEQAMQRYAGLSENWYDGSVDSVDHRLAQCDKLLHSIRCIVGRFSIADSGRYLHAAEHLESDRQSLAALRQDLLTGASNRADVVGPPGWRPTRQAGSHAYDPNSGTQEVAWDLNSPYSPKEWTERDPEIHPPVQHGEYTHPQHGSGRHEGALTGSDGRWVELEAAKFVAANSNTLDDSHELATRAHEHAALKTSTFTKERSSRICEAFVSRVGALRKQAYRPPVVRTAAYEDFDDGLMFLA